VWTGASETILATGELGTLRNVRAASMVCIMAGADFIKTSTGKEPTNATLPVSLIMVRAARDYFLRTGHMVGFKPAGGIRTTKQSLDWLALMKEELGNPWLRSNLFRIGASGLLTDIERQLWHNVTGHYSAAHHLRCPDDGCTTAFWVVRSATCCLPATAPACRACIFLTGHWTRHGNDRRCLGAEQPAPRPRRDSDAVLDVLSPTEAARSVTEP
jgi:hypothetical protein